MNKNKTFFYLFFTVITLNINQFRFLEYNESFFCLYLWHLWLFVITCYFITFITNSVPAFDNVKTVEGYYMKNFTLLPKEKKSIVLSNYTIVLFC